MFVCVCNALTQSDFCEAAARCCRATSAEDLFAELDAAPCCRTCIPEVEAAYVQPAPYQPVPEHREQPTA